MKKKKLLIIFLSILIITIITIFVFNNINNKKFTLVIRESSWSGWTPDYKPKEITKEYEVILGKKYTIGENLTFTIKRINKNSIIIKTNEPFSDSKKGIDLNTNKTKFKIVIDEELELTTPSMDEGNIYYLTLKNKKH